MTYLQITIPVSDPAVQEILIANLAGSGYEGFEEQPEHLQAFIPEEKFSRPELEEILAPWQLSYTSASIGEKNWNEEWEKDFHPVVVEEFCAIRASFHDPVPGVAHEIVITPKMSFGTGHHATTWMMIQAMQHLEYKDRRFLDFGTGTGVLAILAARLGAPSVLAVDNDPWSIENALENVAENQARTVFVEKMDTLPPGETFDTILANVNRHVILKELPRMRQQLNKGGVILLSGLLLEDFEDIEKEALKLKLPISERRTRVGWICLKLEKEDN